MSLHMRPEAIEAESFRIIDEEVGPHLWSSTQWPIVRRVIHTSADFDYAKSLIFSPNAVAHGVAALRQGKGIVTDTTMALSGISKPRLKRFGITASCHVADQDVVITAQGEGITRSVAAMRKALANPTNSIFVIGNAPTALFELLRLVTEAGVRPDLVIGLPVGFVGAAESKEQLIITASDSDLHFISNLGRKGGSTIAAAVINALLIMADEG
jgi:precorrin-8X/cobalt-precorrin-8 methylmutase